MYKNIRSKTNMMKINESDIKAMVAECVKRIIKENTYSGWDAYYSEAKARVEVETAAGEVFGYEGEDDEFLEDLENIYKQAYDNVKVGGYTEHHDYSKSFDGTYLFVYGHFYGGDVENNPKIDDDRDETLEELRDNLNQLVDKYGEERIDAFFNEVSTLIKGLTAGDFELIHRYEF